MRAATPAAPAPLTAPREWREEGAEPAAAAQRPYLEEEPIPLPAGAGRPAEMARPYPSATAPMATASALSAAPSAISGNEPIGNFRNGALRIAPLGCARRQFPPSHGALSATVKRAAPASSACAAAAFVGRLPLLPLMQRSGGRVGRGSV